MIINVKVTPHSDFSDKHSLLSSQYVSWYLSWSNNRIINNRFCELLSFSHLIYPTRCVHNARSSWVSHITMNGFTLEMIWSKDTYGYLGCLIKTLRGLTKPQCLTTREWQQAERLHKSTRAAWSPMADFSTCRSSVTRTAVTFKLTQLCV